MQGVNIQPSLRGQNSAVVDNAMRNYSVEYFAAHCRCGSSRCRDRITGWKDLPAQRKADYDGFVAPYLTDIDDTRRRRLNGHASAVLTPAQQLVDQLNPPRSRE
jgi:hypothetical protein